MKMTWKKMDKILQQVSEMTTQLHQLSDAVRKFEKCKTCKKKYNRSVDDGEVRFEDKPSSFELTPPLSVSPPPKGLPSNSPLSCSIPLPLEKTPTRKQTNDTTVLIGSSMWGVYACATAESWKALKEHTQTICPQTVRTCAQQGRGKDGECGRKSQ